MEARSMEYAKYAEKEHCNREEKMTTTVQLPATSVPMQRSGSSPSPFALESTVQKWICLASNEAQYNISSARKVEVIPSYTR